MTDHNQDSDCTVVDDTCTGCGVVHGLPCEACGGTGFHKDTCARVEVRLAEEALANAREALAAVRRVSAFRAKVCADLRTAARLAREAMCAMLEARDDSFDLIPERDKRPADEGVTFFEDDDRSKLWNDLLVAAENIEDAEDAALALAEHIEKNGANI